MYTTTRNPDHALEFLQLWIKILEKPDIDDEDDEYDPVDIINSPFVQSLRLFLGILRIVILLIGTINLFVIFKVLYKPYFRSISNVYLISLCVANSIYLLNLTFVTITRFNWETFSMFTCKTITATEVIGKYGSIISVALLAGDRYFVMCYRSKVARYRNYKTAITILTILWSILVSIAIPRIVYSRPVTYNSPDGEPIFRVCLVVLSGHPKLYGIISATFMFVGPLCFIVYCYYRILKVIRKANRRRKRLGNNKSRRRHFKRIVRLISWIIIFHILCWSPYWLYCTICSLFKLQMTIYFRLIKDILHVLPYANCALNPFLYIWNSNIFKKSFLYNYVRIFSTRKMYHVQEPRHRPLEGSRKPKIILSSSRTET